MKSPLFILSTLLFTMSSSSFSQPVKWQDWSEQIFAKATTEDKLVLVDLSAEWCAFCKKMDETTWQNQEVFNSINNHYIPVRIEDEKHPLLAEKFRQYGRPAFLILDQKQQILFKKTGYFEPRFTHWTLEAVAAGE